MKKKSPLVKAFLLWICFSFVITILCGLIYITIQQNYRNNANDPQFQIAEDVAAKLSNGASVASVVPQKKLILSKVLHRLSSYICKMEK